jgi:hypothetical protein
MDLLTLFPTSFARFRLVADSLFAVVPSLTQILLDDCGFFRGRIEYFLNTDQARAQ